MKNPADKIKRVGMIGNAEKTACAKTVRQAAELVLGAGRQLYSEAATASLAGLEAVVCPDAATLTRQVDLLLVFGGDGTLLGVARQIAGSRTPILGINIGSLGFLTAISSDEVTPALRHVWAGEFSFESRILIQGKGFAIGRTIEQTALNDIVVSRGIASRLVELEVRVNADLLTRYRCDGLIVSSPTGSTAYTLAAGGAVVFPTAPVLELTPISPHTLSHRPLILPLTTRLEVKVISEKPTTILSADGQVISELAVDDVVTIGRSQRAVRLMHLKGSSFCETLRRKLHWRGATI